MGVPQQPSSFLEDSELSLPPVAKKPSQLKALFYKNLSLQSKQKCTNVCQILTPVICLLFTYLMKVLASDGLPSGVAYVDKQYPWIFNDATGLYQAKNPGLKKSKLQWYLIQCGQQCDQVRLGTNDGETKDPNTLLGNVLPTWNQTVAFHPNAYISNTTTIDKTVPFFLPSTATTINADLFSRISTLQTQNFDYIRYNTGLDYLPDGTYIFQTLNATHLVARIQVDDTRDLDLHRLNLITKWRERNCLKDDPKTCINGSAEISTPYGMLSMVDLLTSSFLQLQTGQTQQSGFIFFPQTLQASAFVDTIINTVGALVFPLALSLLFPVMLYAIVLQKQERLIQMMKMNGMKIRNYWAIFIGYNFLLCLITNIIFFGLGVLTLGIDFFERTSYALLTIVAIGWILAQIGMACFFQTFLNKARSANIIGYLIAIWTMMIGSTFSIGVYQVPARFPTGLMLVPPFAFNRLFYLMLNECSDNYCYESLSSITDEMKSCILSLYLGFIILFTLGAYLFEIVPQELGVKRSPLFPLKGLWRLVKKDEDAIQSETRKDRDLRKYIAQDEEDQFSKTEREAVINTEDTSKFPLVINNMRKLYKKQGYPTLYPAVRSFNLRVHPKQTFGLLGPNGAGKTTLISMITGMFESDFGCAWIGGYSTATQIEKAQLEMGVCPQFDLLWPQLTVQEHLFFYARLKGLGGQDINDKVNEAIQEVKLTEFKRFAASSLSGGMKRRLSIAISLVGDPKIVFLDEPSTGLDPQNRRQLWQVLSKCQQKRALFLTTHMMEEADTLCHRVGIITHGTLRTVENQLKLKKTYGGGYRLNLNLIKEERKLVNANLLRVGLQEDNQNENQRENMLRRSISQLVDSEQANEKVKLAKINKKVVAYITEKFSGATLSKSFSGSLIFKIPLTFKISDIFSEISMIQQQLSIADTSVSNASLEDVFMNVVSQYDKYADIDEEGQEGEDRLMRSIERDSLEEEKKLNKKSLKEELEVQPPVVPKLGVKSPDDQKYGSVIEKDHQSILSQQQAQQNNNELPEDDSDSDEQINQNQEKNDGDDQ